MVFCCQQLHCTKLNMVLKYSCHLLIHFYNIYHQLWQIDVPFKTFKMYICCCFHLRYKIISVVVNVFWRVNFKFPLWSIKFCFCNACPFWLWHSDYFCLKKYSFPLPFCLWIMKTSYVDNPPKTWTNQIHVHV